MTKDQLKSEIFKFILQRAKELEAGSGKIVAGEMVELLAETFEGVGASFDVWLGKDSRTSALKEAWEEFATALREVQL